MKWKELEPDVTFDSLSGHLTQLDCFSAVNVLMNILKGYFIYTTESCVQTITDHVISDKKEVGGILLGEVYEDDLRICRSEKSLIIITEAIPSIEYKNTSISLKMGSSIWCRITDKLSSKKNVVGWYHSHPNLGAFFSGTDIKTQKSFFDYHYSIGWVIDPIRHEERIFSGGNSEEYTHPVLILDENIMKRS